MHMGQWFEVTLAATSLFIGCSSSQPQWYHTCGEPVCIEDAGTIDSGVDRCVTQQVGEACNDMVGQKCDPGIGCGVLLECAYTNPVTGGCPISRRSAKQDIAYLSPADVEKEASEVLAIPLAHYRYRTESADRAPHLGFIIDDVGPRECVDWDSGTVDLYGYTSMAVAALQTQQREIQELRARVNELERKLSAPQRPTPRPAARAAGVATAVP